VRRELVAAHDGLRIGYDESVEGVDADILDVDVGHQRVEHLALGVAYVALKLRQQRHGSGHGHALEHVFLPVLAHRHGVARYAGGQVVGYDSPAGAVRNHCQDALAEGVYGLVESLAASPSGCEHDLGGRFKVLLVDDVGHVGFLSVGLAYDGQFQLACEIVERVAHPLDLLRLVEPRFHLRGVGLHLRFKVVIYHPVLLCGAGCGAVEAFLYDGEAVEHLRRDVQREHCHEDDIHQVDHLLARGYRSFLYCHSYFLLLEA
jgi:hypothetical protein